MRGANDPNGRDERKKFGAARVLVTLALATPLWLLPAAGADEGAPDRVDYVDCKIHGMEIWLPRALVEERIPTGVEPLSEDPLGLTARVEVIGFACAAVTSGSFAHADAAELRLLLKVAPPEEHRGPESYNHYISLGSVPSQADVAAVYAAWNLPAEAGAVRVEEQDVVAARRGLVAASGPSSSWELHTAVESPVTFFRDAVSFRVFGVRDGVITNYVDIDLGAGAFSLGSGKWLAHPKNADPDGWPHATWNANTPIVGFHFGKDPADPAPVTLAHRYVPLGG